MNSAVSEWIGWISAAVLAATITRQVYTQWRTRSSEGVSRWLFVGQMAASAGFVAYSYLLSNWVFVFMNAFNFFAALAGQWIDTRNRRQAASVKNLK